MDDEEYLKSVDWMRYLKREQSLWMFSAVIRTYGTDLARTSDFRFEHLLQTYEGGSRSILPLRGRDDGL